MRLGRPIQAAMLVAAAAATGFVASEVPTAANKPPYLGDIDYPYEKPGRQRGGNKFGGYAKQRREARKRRRRR